MKDNLNEHVEDVEDAEASPDESSLRFEEASRQAPVSWFREFWDFLVHHKKWWMAPILILLLVFSLFVLLTNSAIAPFIYVLF